MKKWKGDISSPVVTICCITYNHKDYISEAIESFLMQETDFPFEVLIRDDCSTDGTTEIVKRFAERYPKIIKAILEKENTFSKGVRPFPELYKIANGKYIALCEGDDYWTDPKKIQKQIDFLEKNTDVDIVHTDFDIFDMKKGKIIKSNYKSRGISFPEKYHRNILLKDGLMRTMTVCFRREMIDGLEEHIKREWSIGDLPTFLYIAREKEYIGFLSESTGVYRRNLDSASAFTSKDLAYDFFRKLSPIRFYFYDYYKIRDPEILEYIKRDTHDKMFLYSTQSFNRPFAFKSMLYKILSRNFGINDMKLFIVYAMNKMRVFGLYQNFKAIFVRK